MVSADVVAQWMWEQLQKDGYLDEARALPIYKASSGANISTATTAVISP